MLYSVVGIVAFLAHPVLRRLAGGHGGSLNLSGAQPLADDTNEMVFLGHRLVMPDAVQGGRENATQERREGPYCAVALVSARPEGVESRENRHGTDGYRAECQQVRSTVLSGPEARLPVTDCARIPRAMVVVPVQTESQHACGRGRRLEAKFRPKSCCGSRLRIESGGTNVGATLGTLFALSGATLEQGACPVVA